MPERRFPDGFLWGASTAAHQVEGGLTNDWDAWEREHAARLAGEAEQKFCDLCPVWEEIKTEATDPANYIAGRADEHWERFEADVALMRELNLTAYRFSIDWSRVEPREGEYDAGAIARYGQMVATLKQNGIEPFVTLWHWPVPLWLRDKGGWEWSGTPAAFEAFVRAVVPVLAPSVRYWITLNEPNVYATFSYLTGDWPPGRKSVFAHERVLNRLQVAHRRAYRAIKSLQPTAQVGVAPQITDVQAGDGSLVTRAHRWLADWLWNRRFLQGIRTELDFVGANIYGRNVIRGLARNQNENRVRSDLGWELYPPAMLGALRVAGSFGKPVYITENGLADRNDTHREWFIRETLEYVHQAIEEGIDVRGYLHWSLMDNFEWDKGFWPRFGLIEVDRQTLERRVRPSARTYARIARTNAL